MTLPSDFPLVRAHHEKKKKITPRLERAAEPARKRLSASAALALIGLERLDQRLLVYN